jgi:hypothetical protein
MKKLTTNKNRIPIIAIPNAGVVSVAEHSRNMSPSEMLDKIEEMIKDFPPESQNEIVIGLVRNNAIRRYEEMQVVRSNMNRADEAGQYFYKKVSGSEQFVKEHLEEKEKMKSR